MPKKKPPAAEKENAERWLLTYADLITLLMVFFVVLYSMSSVNAQKFSELSESLSIMFGQTGRSGVLDGGRTVLPDPKTHKQPREITNTKNRINKLIAKMGLEGKIQATLQERGLVISMHDTVLFKLGNAELGPEAKAVMGRLAQVLTSIPNAIRIEGHTDNIPIHTSQFFSNWELSTARATNVLQFLAQDDLIVPDRLSAAGYGQYRPIADNSTEYNRAINRRVDIVVLSEEFNRFEPGQTDTLGTEDVKSPLEKLDSITSAREAASGEINSWIVPQEKTSADQQALKGEH